MSYQFVKNGTGGADDGTTMDDAWETLEAALEASPSAGDVIIVRRGHSEIPTSDIAVTGDGTAADPIKVIGFPRAARWDLARSEAQQMPRQTEPAGLMGVQRLI